MLRSLRLCFQRFTPVESAVLNSVVEVLPVDASATCEQQIAAVNRVQRYLDWTEINLYCIKNGRPNWVGVPSFSNRSEFTLSESSFTIGNRRFTTRIVCISGHVFSLITRPSIKRVCFNVPSDLETVVVTDAMRDVAEPSPELPESYTGRRPSGEKAQNGWSVLPVSETYTVHMPNADCVVLAVRGDEFLLSRIGDDAETIYLASTTETARALGKSLSDAITST